MYRFGIGELDMRISELRSLTIFELNHKMAAWQRQEDRTARKFRKVAYSAIAPYLEKRTREKDFWPLPTDSVHPKMSKDRIKEDVNRKLRAYAKAHTN